MAPLQLTDEPSLAPFPPAPQASSWLGERLEGLVRAAVGPGDTLFLPSAWPHAVSTPAASVVVGESEPRAVFVGHGTASALVSRTAACLLALPAECASRSRTLPALFKSPTGGNYLHPLDFGAIAACARREQRLGVRPKFQYPLFRKLLWYAAESALFRHVSPAAWASSPCAAAAAVAQLQLRDYAQQLHLPLPPACSPCCRLRQAVQQGVVPTAVGMSAWELAGLPALAGLLREWLQQQQLGRRSAGESRAAELSKRCWSLASCAASHCLVASGSLPLPLTCPSPSPIQQTCQTASPTPLPSCAS